MAVYIAHAYQTRAHARVIFMFAISISNPTDIDNSVRRVELRLAHTTELEQRSSILTRIDHDAAALVTNTSVNVGSATILELPLRIDAHQTKAGWVLFSVPNALYDETVLDSYTIIIEDTHGASTVIEPIIIQQWVSGIAT